MARPGIQLRHSRTCRSQGGGSCNCDPSYRAWVYDARSGSKIRKTFHNLAEAKGWRADATSAIRKGALRATSKVTLGAVAETFIEGIDAGTILNRKGEVYKPSVRRGVCDRPA